MLDPSPDTVARFYELLQPGHRIASGGYRRAWPGVALYPIFYRRTPRSRALTVRQALQQIFTEFGQAEQVRLTEWVRQRLLATREEDPI